MFLYLVVCVAIQTSNNSWGTTRTARRCAGRGDKWMFPLNCHQTCQEKWNNNETRMGELSQLHHEQRTRHFGEKHQLHHQRSSWHLFAYKLLCCLQLQSQRIGLHLGWLDLIDFCEIAFTTWDSKMAQRNTRHPTLIPRKLDRWFPKTPSPGNNRKSIAACIFFNGKSLKTRVLGGQYFSSKTN